MSDNPIISTSVSETTLILDQNGNTIHTIDGLEPINISSILKLCPLLKQQQKFSAIQQRTTTEIINRITIEK